MTGVRSTESVVTFRHPFFLKSLGVLQPPGSYRLVVDEMAIDGLSFLAYRRIATMLHLPAIGTFGAVQQVFSIDPHELDLACAADRLPQSASQTDKSCSQ